MKKLKLLGMLCVLLSTSGFSQNPEIKAVKETITAFSKAGDNSDDVELAKYLDDNYRIVMNRLFGSAEVIVMPKSVYLEKIKTKEFGGDHRKLTFEEMVINGPTASAKVSFEGSKLTFVSLITLIKEEEGNWKLVSEVLIVR